MFIKLLLLSTLLSIIGYIRAFSPQQHFPIPTSVSLSMQQQSTLSNTDKVYTRVAFIGNSILYYNDSPRFLVNLSKGHANIHQDSCLRGGTNLQQLWEQGNGMSEHGFKEQQEYPTVQSLLECSKDKQTYDYIIFNDHTQAPARLDSRKATQQTLLDHYLPLILQNEAVPIIIETSAYRYPNINNSNDLGSANEFQKKVKNGVESYVHTLQTKLPKKCHPRVAPVGTAYLYVHDDNQDLWARLFDLYDHFHPSLLGTFLQGCVLHCTVFSSPPPLPQTDEDIASLWSNARYIKTGKNRPFPSVEEAAYLLNVAKIVCGIDEVPESSL